MAASRIESVRLDDDAGVLIIIDQSRLPNELEYMRLQTQEEIWEAIYQLKVRGAPAIGIAAAYGLYLSIRNCASGDRDEALSAFTKAKKHLSSARPTAVNLFWAMDRMKARLDSLLAIEPQATLKSILLTLRREANQIRTEDESTCRSIGEHSLSLLEKGWGLLTHCNAGALATARYGTALAPIYLGFERGYHFRVFADETRPLLQGARLTAWELSQAGIDITLICDNMTSIVMSQGKIDAVLVGCDRVAANGDSANKIGTSGVAILAAHYGIPFYIHAPFSTIDFTCADGDGIKIEERAPEEVTEAWYCRRMAPPDVAVYNPAFDVTKAKLITAIITEKGIAYPPFSHSLRALASS